MLDDVIIGTLLDAIKWPLLAADFDVEAASEEQPDLDAKEFLWQNMNMMHRQTWRSHVVDALESIEWGFSIGEIVLEKRDDGRLWLANIEPRGQETLFKWGFDNEEDRDIATSFIQRDPDTGSTHDIPLDKTVHMTFRGRKGNPQGKPLLRDIYRPWRFQKDMENLEAIGVERDVGGMPIYEWPEEPHETEDEDAVKEMLRNLRNDEEAYAMIPHGAKLIAYSGGSKNMDIGAVIDRYKKEILMRGFAQWLMLGMGNVGTQALVQGDQDFFQLGLQAIQQILLETWNQQLVSFLFRYNSFPGITELPRMRWNNPGKVDLSALLDAYVKGGQAGILTPTEDDEEYVRSVMDAPDLPEGEGLGPRGPAQPELPPGFPGAFTHWR